MTTLNIREREKEENNPCFTEGEHVVLDYGSQTAPVSWEHAVLRLIYLGKCF